jgi:hypothetical protein
MKVSQVCYSSKDSKDERKAPIDSVTNYNAKDILLEHELAMDYLSHSVDIFYKWMNIQFC